MIIVHYGVFDTANGVYGQNGIYEVTVVFMIKGSFGWRIFKNLTNNIERKT